MAKFQDREPGTLIDSMLIGEEERVLLGLRKVGRSYVLQKYSDKSEHKLAEPIWRPGEAIRFSRDELSRLAAMLKRFERGEAPPSDETVRLAPDQLEELAQRVHELGRT